VGVVGSHHGGRGRRDLSGWLIAPGCQSVSYGGDVPGPQQGLAQIVLFRARAGYPRCDTHPVAVEPKGNHPPAPCWGPGAQGHPHVLSCPGILVERSRSGTRGPGSPTWGLSFVRTETLVLPAKALPVSSLLQRLARNPQRLNKPPWNPRGAVLVGYPGPRVSQLCRRAPPPPPPNLSGNSFFARSICHRLEWPNMVGGYMRERVDLAQSCAGPGPCGLGCRRAGGSSCAHRRGVLGACDVRLVGGRRRVGVGGGWPVPFDGVVGGEGQGAALSRVAQAGGRGGGGLSLCGLRN
jgi:hypothetical protein